MIAELGRVFPQLDRRILEDYARPGVDSLFTTFGEARNVPRLILPPPVRRSNCLGNVQYVAPPQATESTGMFIENYIIIIIILFFTFAKLITIIYL